MRFQLTCNLDLIRRLGPAALSTDGLPGAGTVRLIQLRIDAQNALHEKTVFESDNLLDSAHGAAPIPENGIIDKAIFEIELPNSPTAQKVTLEHPNTVTVHLPEDAPKILALLEYLGLTASRQAATVFAAVLLVLATALAPTLGDADGDDDDPDSDRYSFSI